MNRLSIPVALAGLLALSACTAAGPVEPIPGSITYGGQPRQKLVKSPVGSTFTHRFSDPRGDEWEEVYRIAPDRSLELIARRQADIDFQTDR